LGDDAVDLVNANRLIITQRAKATDATNQYDIRDAAGNTIGLIEQQRQRKLRKALGFVTSIDEFLTQRLTIYDLDRTKVLLLTRPAKLFKSLVRVQDGADRPVGEIVRANVLRKKCFDLSDAEGTPLGRIEAVNWRALNLSIVDSAGAEVGHIDRRFVGPLKALLTPADSYVAVDIQPSLRGDLRLLALGAAAAVDTALKQDPRGYFITRVADILLG
jgi:hypothetical protein